MPKFETQGTTLTTLAGPRRNLRNPTVVGPGGAVSAGPVTVAEDAFTAGDTTALAGRTLSPTSPGGTWSVSSVDVGANFQILSNKARQGGGSGSEFCAVETSVSDCTVSADVRIPAGGNTLNGGLWVRAGSPGAFNTGLAVFLHRVDADEWLELQKVASNSGTTIGTGSPYSFNIVDDTDYAIQVIMLGNDITIKLDGTTRITHTLAGAEIAAYATATKHGLYSYNTVAANFRMDNFKVTTP